MKKQLYILFILVTSFSFGQSPNDFVTTWKTDNPGTSNSTSITIPTYSNETYNYDIDWNNDGTFDEFGVTGNVTHDFGTAGVKTIRIQGQFPRIYFANSGDKDKILSVDQWGNQQWASMGYAFYGCSNLNGGTTQIPAPELSAVTNMQYMFYGASNFNQNIGNWNTVNVRTMAGMFWYATTFNQAIGNWNTSNVTSIASMFAFSTAFNQPINNWDTSNVDNMYGVFSHATNFNQNIAAWNVSNVTDMRNMFSDATNFNQDIGSWDTSAVILMGRLFWSASSFNQNLENWDISSLADANSMLSGAYNFSKANYDNLLIGWQGNTHNTNVSFASSSDYCLGETARNILTGTDGWIIHDGNYDCTVVLSPNDFVTTWKTDNPGISNSTSITIPTTGTGYNYDVDWNNDGTFDEFGLTGNVTHDFGTAGTYTIRIKGSFPRIYFFTGGDKEKILSVDQWGNQQWASMGYAFYGCSNLVLNATDVPDLSMTTNMENMFFECSSLNQNINNWDVSSVTNMKELFKGCIIFNQPLDNWNVSSVTNMRSLFQNCTVFNQPLDTWNVGLVTDMFRMFNNAENFNQDLNNWDTSNVIIMQIMFANAFNFNGNITDWNTGNVTNMTSMFWNCGDFNQNIGSWNTSNVTTMLGMFSSATSFDQNLGNWNIQNLTNAGGMFAGVTLSTTNYDALLIGWQGQAHNNNVSFSGGNSKYCQGENARNILTGTAGWTITDGGLDPACSTVPNCTQLTTPSDTQTNVAISSNLTWSAVTNATGYYITIGTTSGGNDILNNFDNGNSTSYNPPSDFNENTSYYVTIAPYNTVGSASACAETSFTTETISTIPNCTQLTTPADTAIDVVINTNLTWSAVTNATGYYITIGTTSSGNDILNNFDNGNSTSYNPPSDFNQNTTYYVTVIAYNTVGNATMCTETSFTTYSEMIIPKFFTPNSDGYNDTWGIIDRTGTITAIKIFDRYGKLLKVILPNTIGWDGSYNGKMLFADDYWYIIEKNDGTTVRGHFLLKR